jgi:hypothetical protein
MAVQRAMGKGEPASRAQGFALKNRQSAAFQPWVFVEGLAQPSTPKKEA